MSSLKRKNRNTGLNNGRAKWRSGYLFNAVEKELTEIMNEMRTKSKMSRRLIYLPAVVMMCSVALHSSFTYAGVTRYTDKTKKEQVVVDEIDCNVYEGKNGIAIGFKAGNMLFGVGPEVTIGKKEGIKWDKVVNGIIVRYKELCTRFNSGAITLKEYNERIAEIDGVAREMLELQESIIKISHERSGRLFKDLESETISVETASLDKVDLKLDYLHKKIESSHTLKEKKPDWVDGRSDLYTYRHYLVGVGYGATRDTAEKNAFAAISKTFSADISSVGTDYTKYSHFKLGENTKFEDVTDIEQFTKITTAKVLSNITIAETWHDSKKQVFYALAVMDRAKAGNSLKEQIQSLDSQIEYLVRKSRETTDKLQKIRNLKSAIKSLNQREAYNRDLRIVDLSGQGMKSDFNSADLNNEIDDFIKYHFSISVEVAGEKGDKVRQALVEGLSRRGLYVVQAGQPADLVLKGEMEFYEAYTRNQEFKFVKWKVFFDLIALDNDKLIGSICESGKEGHLSIEEAQQSALRSIQEVAAGEIGEKIAVAIYGVSDEGN